MQDDSNRIKNAYLWVLECVGFAAVLVNLVLFIGAEPFLYYVLGNATEKWFPALSTFRIMCCYGILRALLEPIGSVIVAIGKTHLLLKATVLAALIELVLLYPTVKLYGIEGVGVLITVAYLSQYFIYWPVIKKSISIKINDILGVIIPIVMPIIVIGGSFMIFKESIESKYIFVVIPVSVLLFIVMNGVQSGWKLLNQAKAIYLKK
jgi:O-antigen/teichoic acid export membrane protein